MTMIKDAEYHHPGLRGRLQHSAPGNARPEGEGQVGQLEQQERHEKVSIEFGQSTWKRKYYVGQSGGIVYKQERLGDFAKTNAENLTKEAFTGQIERTTYDHRSLLYWYISLIQNQFFCFDQLFSGRMQWTSTLSLWSSCLKSMESGLRIIMCSVQVVNKWKYSVKDDNQMIQLCFTWIRGLW